jgi:signal transduction histidine kinase
MLNHSRRSSAAVKAKPTFQKQLVVSTALFITLVIAVIFGASYYILRSFDTRIQLEITWLSESVAQRVSDEIDALASRNPGESVARSTALRQSLKTFMDAQLQSAPGLYYLILENLEGEPLAQSLKENIRPDEIDLLRRGALKPRQPRSQQIELGSLVGSHLRIRDYGVPLRLDSRSMGQLRLGISNDYLEERMSTIRHEIYRRALILSTIAVALFSFIFCYVRWLVKLAQRLEAQAQEADRLASLGTLASGLAHEIRNPLSAMNLNLQMIEEDLRSGPPQPPGLSQMFESTKREIKRLERLATGFLTYTKPLFLKLHPLDLREFLKEVCADFRSQLMVSGVDFSLEAESVPEARIMADRDLLQQAFLNILINARDAVQASTRQDRHIQVRLQLSNHGYLVEVVDNGIGIPPDRFESIFEIFYSEKSGGTGLGLPIARQIIDRHGGEIHVESRLGEETSFKIFLPA